MCETETEDKYLSTAQKNMIFQASYNEVTRTKSTKLHGHGYLANYRTRRELLQENVEIISHNEAVANVKNNTFRDEVHQLKEQLAHEVA